MVARDVCPHPAMPLTLGFHDEHGIICPTTASALGGQRALQPYIPSSPDQPVPAKLNLINYAVKSALPAP